uniref:Uncharacterized protein n=1 Tax=Romanomermis culicivorax TaxID=13658 RepID=A0A915ICL6_ROMCU
MPKPPTKLAILPPDAGDLPAQLLPARTPTAQDKIKLKRKETGQIVSLQDSVMFCDNLEKELKIQDKLFEQWLQKHHRLVINESKLPEQ